MLQNLGVQISSIGKRIGKWSASWWDLREWAPMLIPDLQEFQRLLAQMDILQQKLINIWSRDTLICERVLGNLTPTPPGVEFWRTKIKFNCAGHRKNEKTTRAGVAGSSLCGVKIEDSTKSCDSSLTVWQKWADLVPTGSTIIRRPSGSRRLE